MNIRPKIELDAIETDPLFAGFINTLAVDAIKHPEKLRGVKEIWDKEWDELLEGVKVNEENKGDEGVV